MKDAHVNDSDGNEDNDNDGGDGCNDDGTIDQLIKIRGKIKNPILSFLNINSIRNKIDNLFDLLENLIDILVIAETKLDCSFTNALLHRTPDRPVTSRRKGILKFSLFNRAFIKEQSSFVSAMTRISMRFSKRSNKLSILFLIELIFRKLKIGFFILPRILIN